MTTLIPTVSVTQNVLDDIEATIGSAPAETGGVLGGDPATGTITTFHFDRQPGTSPHEWNLIADRINPVIREWNRRDIHLMGIVHSHPPTSLTPSCADVTFAHRLLNRQDNAALPQFAIPIVQSGKDAGAFSLRFFTVVREAPNVAFEVPYRVVPAPEAYPVDDPQYARIFGRVRASYDLPRLHDAVALCVGCGGAASFIEDLARAGVGRFFLVDPDTVTDSNIATQAQYLRDVGRHKVDTLRDRIRDINPFARIETLGAPFGALSDSDLTDLCFGDDGTSARLLCGMTDDFWTQWRISLVSLTLGVPALFAQVYRAGAAAEVIFTHPDTTGQCLRCVTSGRFDAYLTGGFRNDAGSQGAQYYATPRLNALKFFVAMALLHHGSSHPFWGGMLERLGQRNCSLIRCDPDLSQTLKLKTFDEVLAGALPDQTFVDETIWRPQHPEHPTTGYPHACPDCGGTGDLHNAIGSCGNTLERVRAARMAAQSKRQPS